MQATTTASAETRSVRQAPTRAARRFGYVVAIGCNVLGLYIAHHLLGWGWPRFLTDQFDEVLPLITVSFVYGMATNAVLVVSDPRWFKALVDVGGALIAFVISLRLFQVYPFDFSGYAVNWSWAVTTVLVLGMVGSMIAAIVGLVRVVTSLTKSTS